MQASCIQFYRQFLESPNFATWFERRRGRAALWQECVWRAAEISRGTEFQIQGVPEVQLVEIFAALETKLALTENQDEDQVRVQLLYLIIYVSISSCFLTV